MRRTSRLSFIALICTTLFLAGCTHEHTWVAATCTEPATCSECGEEDGEPLGHDWVEATCTTPKTCTVCGETEGVPLGHEWIEATHENPETCAVCGETRGEPLLYDVPPGLTTDYQFGEFDTFNSYAYENGLGDTLIWLNGTYDNVTTLDLPEVKQGLQAYCALLTDDDGHVWFLELDWNEYEGIDKYTELEGHQLCIMGAYQGYSDVYGMPAVLMEKMFDRTTGNLIASSLYPEAY